MHARALVAFLCAGLATTAMAQAAEVGHEVMPLIQAAGTAEVLVMLRPPLGPAAAPALRRRAVADLCSGVLAATRRRGVQLSDPLSLVSGFSAQVTADGLKALLEQPDVLRVDAMRYGSGGPAAGGGSADPLAVGSLRTAAAETLLAQSVSQIGATAVHRRDDFGGGVTVAVLDAGVQRSHPDLAGSIIAEECFCSDNCCPNGTGRQSGTGSAFTTLVHGVHVTGTIVSKGEVAPPGVAPAAKVVAVKVLSDENRGALLDWIRALDWIAANRPDVRAINMSLVSDALFAGHCDATDAFNMAFAQILGTLRAQGVLAFVAAGNDRRSDVLASPACVDAAVAVGAVDANDAVPNFSNTDSALDLLAPGVGIVSTGLDGSAATLTGTSMATPHATGTAALLLAINPGLGADQLEAFLKATGRQVLDPRVGLSFPRVDALAAMNAVWRVTAPLPGGGSKRTDCLAEWQLQPPDIADSGPIAGAACNDNDPACDADQIPGQCTFPLALCFNVADRRLPRCATDAPIIAVSFSSVGARAAPAFAADGPPLASVLPGLPITGANVCTPEVAFVVPRGEPRWVRVTARAADGRVDHDRLRLRCR